MTADINSTLVREDAAATVLSVAGVKKSEVLGGLLPLLLTPEPVVEELPSLFLSPAAEHVATTEALHELAVAGKLVYAQVRWLDNLADTVETDGRPAIVHELSETLADESQRRFGSALADTEKMSKFFPILGALYARYAASLALDTGSGRSLAILQCFEDYVAQAKARAAPLRAPLEALLFLIDAPEVEKERARSCFELCAAALQLRDDALDAEEDYAGGRLSWIVSETLSLLEDKSLGADEFYETALLSGILDRNLKAAVSFFGESLGLASEHFPRCVTYLDRNIRDTTALKEDLEELVVAAQSA